MSEYDREDQRVAAAQMPPVDPPSYPGTSSPEEQAGDAHTRIRRLEAAVPPLPPFGYATFASGTSGHTQAGGNVFEEPRDYAPGSDVALQSAFPRVISLSSRGRIQLANGYAYNIAAKANANWSSDRLLAVKVFTYDAGGTLISSGVVGGASGGSFGGQDRENLVETSAVNNFAGAGKNFGLYATPFPLGISPFDPSYTVEVAPVVAFPVAGKLVNNWYLFIQQVAKLPFTASFLTY